MRLIGTGLVVWLAGFVGLGEWHVATAQSNPAAPLLTRQVAPPPPVPSLDSGWSPTNSPVYWFRKLLSMPVAEREAALAGRPATARDFMLAKLREYDVLPLQERELRLQITQLRWYLAPLLKGNVERRQERLQAIPEPDRSLVKYRLKLWDELPPTARQDILTNEAAMSYIARLEADTSAQQTAFWEGITPTQKARLEVEYAQWKGLPLERRRELQQNFQRFFELSAVERQRTLAVLPDPERLRSQGAVNALLALPKEDRNKCLESFRKFAALNPAERLQFLRDAGRWQAMSETQKLAWRELLTKAPGLIQPVARPPLPPGSLALPVRNLQVSNNAPSAPPLPHR